MRSKAIPFLVSAVILIVIVGGYIYVDSNQQAAVVQEEEQQDIPESPTIPEEERILIKDDCFVSGCNGELCAEEPKNSACLFLPYAVCYDEAFTTCEKQSDGLCGWTQTSELKSCLESFDE